MFLQKREGLHFIGLGIIFTILSFYIIKINTK
jgi:hypothetical protein